MNVQMTATSFTVPGQKQTSEQLATLLQVDAQWIRQNVGVVNRYVSTPGDDPATLAAQAAKTVIEQRGEPDLVIYASATVRQLLPDTSVFVARELGLDGVPCFSVHATCLSFLVALNQATLMIKSGQHCKVLIACAELATQSRNFQHPESAVLFGDAAAAVMVEPSNRNSGAIHYRQKTWPQHADLAEIRGGGLLRHPQSPHTCNSDYLFQMDGERLLRATFPYLKTFLNDFFHEAGVAQESIDWLVPHQASFAGMKLLGRMGFDETKTIDILADYGNCVSASIPMALATAVSSGKIQPGDRILFLGSASGLSLGATLWTW